MEPEFGGADAVNDAEFNGAGVVDGATDFEADTVAAFDAADPGPDTDTASDELDIDGSLLDSIEQELAEVERALALIDDGTYGQCEACGRSINDAVLDRTPTSRFCAEHLPLSLR